MSSSIENIFQAFAVLSVVCSGSVLLTATLFPQMRGRLFMKIILYISFTNMMAAIASSFGFPRDNSGLCVSQAFLAPYFFISSWLWTTMLAHQLYTVATQAQFGMQHKYMHAICWLIPLALCLLPLTTNRYGRDDDDGDPTSWCYIAGNAQNGEVWVVINFIIPMCFCLSTMIYYSSRTFWLFYSDGVNRPDLYATVHALMLYPLAMILTWGPNLIFIILMTSDVIRLTSSADSVSVVNLSSVLCTQSGTITAAIFFYKSREARYHWARFFSRYLCFGSAELTESSVGSELKLSIDSSSKPKEYGDLVTIQPDFEETGYRTDITNKYAHLPTAKQNGGNGGSGGSRLNTVLLLMFGEGERIRELANNPLNETAAAEGRDGDSISTTTDPLLRPYSLRGDSFGSNAAGWGHYPDDRAT